MGKSYVNFNFKIFRYEEDLIKSTILKQQWFKILSTIFTLATQAIFDSKGEIDYNNYSLQVLSNLVTSALLNYFWVIS